MDTKTVSTGSRGSEWRKWDLHVHSPASHGFKGDYAQFVVQVGASDCAVIGINDYVSVAGYKETLRRLHQPNSDDGNKAYRDALEKLRTKTLLPVVEFRMTNALISKKVPSGTRINFHVIFSNEIDVDDIETFLKGLKVKDQSIGKRYNDSKFLHDEVAVNFEDVVKALNDDETFKGKFLIWMPYDEYGGIDEINPHTHKLFKDGLIRKADVLGSGNKKQAEFFLWKDPKYSQDDYVNWFGRRKPSIKGSDSHGWSEEIGRLKDHESKPIDRHCWIKADPTFNGLRQIINEPEDRVFIGDQPPKLAVVNQRRTKFLSRIQIHKTDEANVSDPWFEVDLPLSPDMVAIIGNKGSGKSALADIIALAGDTSQAKHFSFLKKEKFREKKLAANFEVIVTWADDVPDVRNLQNDPPSNKIESIKYISHTYLESVCASTSGDESSAFQNELRQVIFSHIAESDRLEKKTLDELIEYRTEEIGAQINLLRQQIGEVNARIVAFEQKGRLSHRQQIDEALVKKKQELDAHDKAKPAEVAKPESITSAEKDALAAAQGEISGIEETLASVEAEMASATVRQKTLSDEIALASKLEGALTVIENEFALRKQPIVQGFKSLGLDFDTIAKLMIDRAPLIAKKAQLQKAKSETDTKLDSSRPDSLPAKQKGLSEQLVALRAKLDEPNRRYQAFLQQIKVWAQGRVTLEGAADKVGTVKYLEAQLSYLDKQLAVDLAAARKEREVLALKVHHRTAEQQSVHAELFAPVQNLIETSPIIKEGFKLTFASTIVRRGFRRRFFEEFVSHGPNGSFCGTDPGETRLTELLETFDLTKAEDATQLAAAVEDHLRHDYRTSKRPEMDVASQLRKFATVKGLYDFLWSFEYLVPEYALKLDGKDLHQLSPGERGALLLVFYLLVDKSELPIVVDQPEENLDNQTVFKLLIPVIKDAKKKRQIIMVTHNPNIAVVCDAEQIIHAAFDRSAGNAINYSSGSIENPAINRKLVDILEGTRPAFDNRDGKYYRV